MSASEPVPVPDAWGDVFGDVVVAGAILDRLMHRAVVFNIKGPSWRMREHQALAEAVKA
jgi:DNA replication protein DnaC